MPYRSQKTASSNFYKDQEYEKDREDSPCPGGYALPKWYTGIVVGRTSKLYSPRYLCIRADDNDLILVRAVKDKEIPGFDLPVGVRVSVYGSEKKHDTWSPFGGGTLLDILNEVIEGYPPSEPSEERLTEPPGNHELIRLTELSEHWNIPERTLRARIASGHLPAEKQGKTWYIRRSNMKL